MAADYVERIREIQPDGPYHLLGWSFGGLVAHAMATRLQADGQQLGSLTLLDSYPVGEVQDARVDTEEEARALLLDSLGADDGTDPAAELDADLVAALVRVVMNNAAIMDTFTPGRLRGDVLLVVAGRTWDHDRDPAAVWQPYVDGVVRAVEVDSDHDRLVRPGAAAQYGPELADRLASPHPHHTPPRC
jgi:thioesterase domain-containing protein